MPAVCDLPNPNCLIVSITNTPGIYTKPSFIAFIIEFRLPNFSGLDYGLAGPATFHKLKISLIFRGAGKCILTPSQPRAEVWFRNRNSGLSVTLSPLGTYFRCLRASRLLDGQC
jgi:hypothetical protein